MQLPGEVSLVLRRVHAFLIEGGSCRLADVAVHQSDVVGSRDLGGLGHLPGIGNDVETPFDQPLHDARADPLRRAGHDGCLP